MHFYKTSLLLFLIIACGKNFAQQYLMGNVYDSTKINLIPGVKVLSTSGLSTLTDSTGKYQLQVNEGDSVFFIYNNKPTQKFSVKSIKAPQQFDISLKVHYKGKYSTLKEVIVYTKTYRQDSLENRANYADIFNFEKPGIETSISPGGVAGMDLDELINLFRFKRNKRIKAFQKRLEAEEQEKYVNYRFSKITVKRITHLPDDQLDNFMIRYRPSYDFTANTSEIEFNQYILNASYEYKTYLLKMK